MENLGSQPIHEKSNDDCRLSQFQTLGEMERQYTEHYVTRDAKLETLQTTINENTQIINQLRVDIKAKQMELEKRTDAYTALIPLRSQLLEMRAKGQEIYNTALKEQESTNLEIKQAEEILNSYKSRKETDEKIPDDHDLNDLKKDVELLIHEFDSIKKEHRCRMTMKQLSLNFVKDSTNWITLLKELSEENMAMSGETLDLTALNEERDRLEAVIASKTQSLSHSKTHLKELQDRTKELKEGNEKMSEKANQIQFELEMHTRYRKELEDKISELGLLKNKSEIEIEEVNHEWNKCDAQNAQILNGLEEDLDRAVIKLNELRQNKEKMQAEYVEGKKTIMEASDLEKGHVMRAKEFTARIKHLVQKKEGMAKRIEELRGTKLKFVQQFDETRAVITDYNYQLEKIEEKKENFKKILEELINQKQSEENVAEEHKKMMAELVEERLHMSELKTILSNGISKIEQNIDELGLPMDDTDLTALKTPIIGDKLIETFEEGIEKWKIEMESLTKGEMNRKNEIQTEWENRLKKSVENCGNLSDEIAKQEKELGNRKRSSMILDNELLKYKQERDELQSMIKIKKKELEDKRASNDYILSQDLFTHHPSKMQAKKRLYIPSKKKSVPLDSETD